jgi:hypothetical protein
MTATFSFEFGHRFILVCDWPVAFLVYTDENVYTPDPASLSVAPRPGGLTLTAQGFAGAGLQQRAAGTFRAEIWYVDGGFECDLEAALTERIKGTTLLLRDRRPKSVPTRDYGEEACPPHGALLDYPSSLRLPVFPLERADGSFLTIASLDERVRGKTVAVVPDGDGATLELHHYEDARHWSPRQVTPTWRVVRGADPAPLFAARREIAERAWGLRPWETRADVPGWARELGLVLNLHGVHWTGYVFNTYAQQLDIIRYVAERIEGRRVLAYLAAWDGRYNYNWPRYEAEQRLGGADGLRRLVAEAHRLGVRVIPQIGAVSANRRYLPSELHRAACQDAYGNTYVKNVDWDNDRAPDTYRVNANLGHPGFRQFLLEKTFAITEAFGFDGIFLDINMQFSNDPRFHLTEGHRAFAAACHERFKDYLLFGENWYDGLLPIYPLVHSVTGRGAGVPHRWADVFDRYCRTTYHLIHPAPGRGSTGVYEAGYLPVFEPDPNVNAIPAISFVEDTLRDHRAAIDRHLEIARTYLRRMGI